MKKDLNHLAIQKKDADVKALEPFHYRSKELWTFGEQATDYTVPSDEIVTVPNESFTIMELIDRSRKGLPLTGNAKTPVYHDTDDFDSPDLDQLGRKDLVDQSLDIQDLTSRAAKAQAAYDKAVSDQQQKLEREKASQEKKPDVKKTSTKKNEKTE